MDTNVAYGMIRIPAAKSQSGVSMVDNVAYAHIKR